MTSRVSLLGASACLPWKASPVPSSSHPEYMTAAAVAPTSSLAPKVRLRARIACRRCRRMRSKCVHDQNNPYCRSCKLSGVDPKDCVYPVRGEPDIDREFRHPRVRDTKIKASNRRQSAKGKGDTSNTSRTHITIAELADTCELPPTEELVEAVGCFCNHSFQLSFIPRDEFCSKLRDNPKSIDSFLLMSILAVSARLSSLAVERYKSGNTASLVYLERTSAMSIDQIRQGPSLERCQALCLLSIAQHCHGFEKESYINLGIAIRMASWLQLHKEETFQVDTPSPQAIRTAEAARRTLWMLFCQEILITRGTSILFLSPRDITTLLPCSEHDFSHGQDSSTRASLINRFPVNRRPGPSLDQGQSLFASSVQIFYIWGTIQRKLAHYKQRPWQGGFDHEVEHIKQRLKLWELGLPEDHTWSLLILQEHQSNGHDLAYLKVTMMPRLCNIAVRQPWVEEIIHCDPAKAQQEPYIMTSLELYKEVYMLFLQINNLFSSKLTSKCGEDQIFALCVYTCGLLSAYLCKYPLICQDRSIIDQGPRMLTTILSIFEERLDIWPQAARWKDELSSIQYYPASSVEKKAQAQVCTVNQLDGPTTSGIKTAHLPPAATIQYSTSIQEMASSKRKHSSHLVSVSLRHLYQGCPYPQANGLPQSRTLSQSPRYTMNSQEYDTASQIDDRISSNPYSAHPLISTTPTHDYSYTDAQISILGPQRVPLYPGHSDDAVSKDTDFESGVPVQLVHSRNWAA